MQRIGQFLLLLALGAGLVAGCGAKENAVDQVLADSGVELNGLGGSIPDSFPDDVPLPSDGVTLDTAVGAAGIYTMRYSLTDPAAATAAYKSALTGAGFTIETEFDNLATAGGNVGFVAGNGTWTVTTSAFGPGPVDGNYMGVVVQPAS